MRCRICWLTCRTPAARTSWDLRLLWEQTEWKWRQKNRFTSFLPGSSWNNGRMSEASTSGREYLTSCSYMYMGTHKNTHNVTVLQSTQVLTSIVETGFFICWKAFSDRGQRRLSHWHQLLVVQTYHTTRGKGDIIAVPRTQLSVLTNSY